MVPHLEIGLIGVGTVWIHHCVECGFRQIRPRLARSALEIIYGDDYFDPSKGQGFSEYGRQRQRYEREAFFLVNALHRSGHEQGRLLEVGSGLGFLLNAVSRTSPWVVEGVELSSFGAKYARERFGLTIQNSTLEDVRYPNGYFDFVVQKDLLEHVTNPRRHLEETHRIMRSGSRLWLITPNGEADIRPLHVHKASLAKGRGSCNGPGPSIIFFETAAFTFGRGSRFSVHTISKHWPSAGASRTRVFTGWGKAPASD